MNLFCAIETEYLKPSRTIETVLVSNKKQQKRVFYVYNNEGYSFRVFDSITSLLEFFNSNIESNYHFETENELDSFFSAIEIK